MLSPHIISALLVEREADLRRRAEQARLRRPDPWADPTAAPTAPSATAVPESGPRSRWHRRRRHLRPA
ncbi:hypothetical protein [Terrabacter sp. 2RAF25]|uniref:hypothetical protein n=1 Tax=Terrabacter sp. 2RAF25 TaxID=3232998 RepID=UPI003F98656B